MRVPDLDVYVLQRELIRQGCMTAYFTDVPYDKDAAGFVSWDWFVPTQILGARQILSGYPDRTFRDYAPMLRSHFAWTIVKAMRLTVQRLATSPYPDLAPDHFAFAAAATLHYYRLSDTPEGAPFEADRALTRGELARWLLIVMSRDSAAPPVASGVSAGRDAPGTGSGRYEIGSGPQEFKDVPPEHPLFGWVMKALATEADGVPLMQPIAPGLFAPDAPARRGEALSALQRVLFPSGMTEPQFRAGRPLWAE